MSTTTRNTTWYFPENRCASFLQASGGRVVLSKRPRDKWSVQPGSSSCLCLQHGLTPPALPSWPGRQMAWTQMTLLPDPAPLDTLTPLLLSSSLVEDSRPLSVALAIRAAISAMQTLKSDKVQTHEDLGKQKFHRDLDHFQSPRAIS